MEQATEKQINFARKLGIENPERFSKNELRVLIDERLDQKESIPVVKPENAFKAPNITVMKPADRSATMYISYAKDIFLKLCEVTEEGEYDKLMNQAINLVNQARKAFE